MIKPRDWLRDRQILRAGIVRIRTALSKTDENRDGVIFLFYHDMQPEHHTPFKQQLRLLQNFGDIISIDSALRILATGQGGRYICLTFDDGYQGAFDNAFPVLASQSIPVAFFVVPQWIDEERAGIICWDNCRQLADAGVEIGSHSLTHRRLSNLGDHDSKLEFSSSRTRIEAETGHPCVHFACPWGQPDTDFHLGRDPDLAQKAGYQTFFTTLPRRAHAHSQPFMLPRIRMEPEWGVSEIRYAFSR